MAIQGRVEAITAVAAVDLSGRQYHILRRSAAMTVNVASNPGGSMADIAGVLINKPNSGEHASIAIDGIQKVTAGINAISVNRQVTSNASGRLAHAASGDYVLGMSVEASGAEGDLVGVLLRLPAAQAPSSLAAA